MITPTQAIMVALAAGNLLLGLAWLSARDDAATARAELVSMQEQRDGALKGAQACSDAVDDLRELADRRKQEGQAARASAAAQARAHEQRADEVLAAPPAVPSDACASAQHRVDSWLQGRAQK